MDPHSKSYVPSNSTNNNTTTQQEEVPRRKFFFPKSNDQSNTNRNINNNNTQIKEKKQIKINVKRNDQPKIREEDNKNKNVERKKITIQKRGEEKKIIVEKNNNQKNNNEDDYESSEINENISELYKSNENLDNSDNNEKKVERKKIFIEPRINKNMDLKKHSELSQDIIKKLNNLSYNCMICFERVNRKEQIWHCIYCYRIFHLNCTKKWEQSCKSEEGSQDVWSCPHCRSIFSDPPSFLCYCGKEKKPQFNTYSIVGSCNNLCGKKRKGECPHLCQNSCHPGSCPSCDEIQYKKCFCGKTKYSIGCSEIDDGRSCGEKCAKLLNCGVHSCDRLCHMGDCGNCTEIELQVCYCGETEQEKTCGTGELDESSGEERYFSCAAICNQVLFCGKHKCERICHKGECGNCATDPKYLKKCPCGRTPLEVLLKGKERTSCTDEIPVCENPCNKMLSCGIHKCKKKCHTDKCGPCLSERKIRCRCGGTKMTKQCNEILQQDFVVSGKGKGVQVIPTSDVPRIDSILCNKKCTQSKSCGKHKCNNICCISNTDKEDLMGIHTCMLPCGKKLNCKKHRCDLICHKGSCSPCLEASFEPRSCPCGKTIQEPPIRCGTAKLNCPYECMFERVCGHSSLNHMSLKHPCHFDNKKCTPCSVLVSVMCWCGKERRNNVPCNQSEGVRCSNKCGKQLSCGIHFCDRVCHRDECQKSEDLIDHPTPPCHQICGIQLEFCEHRCIQKCHPTSDCNVKICSQTSNIFCDCKRKKMSVVCGLGENEEQNKLLIEQRANMLKCDQECEEQMHKTTLSLAFGKMTNSYVQTLVELAMLHPLFLERIEKVFYNLINRDKISDVKYAFPPTIAFPPMDSVKRKIIHLLAKTYNLETVSQNEEPNKRVVVKCSSASRVPKLLLSAYVNLKKNPNDKNCFVIGMLITNLTKINLPFPIDNVYLDTYFKYYKGKYEFHWINDDNVLVVFEDNKTLNQALNSVNGLSISVYNESMNFGEEDRPTPKPRKNYTNSVSITKTTTVIDKEWQQSTQNFYNALKETPITKEKEDSDDGKTDKDDLDDTPNNESNNTNNENVSENWEDDLDSQDN